ncbi:MAG: hypothetical protein JJE25_09615, partial [Bacteroidia bacterium]|nr:hypothetical protein [Bacteroidia bacterium]
MKKIITLLTLLFFMQANAQTINSITILPANPTTNDNVLILADCMFSSGGCDPYMQGQSVTGNTIDTWAF